MRDAYEQAIARRYDSIAEEGESDLCCAPFSLYDWTELAALPPGAVQLSSGCGDPTRFAQIRTGTVVADIGSGAGLDCLKAAKLTGPTGRVIGIDPSPAMRDRARSYAQQLDLAWLSFEDGTADHLPLLAASVDVVISNCVLSLASDPRRVWLEIARVLRPGGWFAVSDVVGGADRNDLRARTRCEVGVSWEEYLDYLQDARFSGIHVVKASPVRFRDGVSAQSVSLSGSYATSPPLHFWQIVAPLETHQQASRSVTGYVMSEGQHLEVDFEILDLADPDTRCLLGLAVKGRPFADGQELPRGYVLVNGRLVGDWVPADGDGSIPVELLRQSALAWRTGSA